MPAVSGNVPNLINGISQQPPAMRLPSQAEMSTNFYPSIVDGNIKRPRTNHTAVLDEIPDKAFTHFIFRDEEEKYVAAIYPDGTLKVWDMEGTEQTVTNNGANYLTGLTDPSKELSALTIADHTFIVNKTRTVEMDDSSKSPARPHEALVHVLQGVYGKTLRIRINNTLVARITLPDGTTPWNQEYTDTVRIADHFYQMLANASISGMSDTDAGSTYWEATQGDRTVFQCREDNAFDTAPWAIGRYHSTLYIRNDNNDFTLAVEDGYAGRLLKDVKKVVQKFSDLPLFAPDGIVVEVKGDDSNGFDNYWVEYQKDDDVNTMGVWRECVAPDTVLGLDADTMPHVLVRNEDGTFTFGPKEWDERVCGDAERNPDPSFVGQQIEAVLFHKNRLGFLTKENLVLSEAGKFYNFFRTTLLTVLDTDPIDIAASHIKVSLLRHAVPYQRELLLFSDQTQFVLTGKELLTPKTVSLDPVTELHSIADVPPIVCGGNIYFVSEKEGAAHVVEYFLDKALETADYDIVTGHVPTYIPAGVTRLIGSPDLNLLLVHSSGDPAALYAYAFYWNGQEKLQSAWVRWEFPGVSEIKDIAFDKGLIRLLVKRGDITFLETIDAEQKVYDTGTSFTTYLDRQVELDDGVYDSGTGKTTFTLPYDVPTGLKVVTAASDTQLPGVEIEPSSTDGDDVVLDGDYTGEPVRFGIPYESRYRFSTFFLRDREANVAQLNGRLQVLNLNVVFSKSAHFKIEVTCEGRAKRTYEWNARTLDDPNNVLDAMVVKSGRTSVPIMSRNDRVIIDLVSDTWMPCAFTSAEWRGIFNPNSRHL